MESRTGTATASMVVGIVAVAGEWLSFIPWFVGLVLGIVAVGLTGVFALCMCVGLPLGLAGFAALL